VLVREYIEPVTWQCAPTDLPGTVSVPAAIELAAVIVVFAKVKPTSEAQSLSAAPTATPSTGKVSAGGVVVVPPDADGVVLPLLDVDVLVDWVGKKPLLPPPPQAASNVATRARDAAAVVFKCVSYDAFL
jgi:hypothetical protein